MHSVKGCHYTDVWMSHGLSELQLKVIWGENVLEHLRSHLQLPDSTKKKGHLLWPWSDQRFIHMSTDRMKKNPKLPHSFEPYSAQQWRRYISNGQVADITQFKLVLRRFGISNIIV